MPKKLMISAGEASGELYGAMLCREVKKIWPDVEISGIGGPRMKEEGVSLIAPISHIMGIVEVFKHLGEIIGTYNKAKNALINNRPDLLILIDYPDFNLILAQKAKQAGIPVLYYVSPQIWAWRKGRINKITALVDKVAVLFPFEVDCYKETGLPCEFVGHPITERIGAGPRERCGNAPARKQAERNREAPGDHPGTLKKDTQGFPGDANSCPHGQGNQT